LTNVETIWIQI